VNEQVFNTQLLTSSFYTPTFTQTSLGRTAISDRSRRTIFDKLV